MRVFTQSQEPSKGIEKEEEVGRIPVKGMRERERRTGERRKNTFLALSIASRAQTDEMR